MGRYDDYLRRAQANHGERFSEAGLHAPFREHFDAGHRVKVRTEYKGGEVHERTGTIGVTTGWQPAFLLMGRSNQRGSSDVLGPSDRVVAVKRGKSYVPVTPQQTLFNDRRTGGSPK